MAESTVFGASLLVAVIAGAGVYHLAAGFHTRAAVIRDSARIEARLAGDAGGGLRSLCERRLRSILAGTRAWPAATERLKVLGVSEPEQTLFRMAGGSALAFLAAYAVFVSVLVAFIFGMVLLLSVMAILSARAARRSERLVEQLPVLLGSVSAGLAAGMSLPQALWAARQDVAAPAREELDIVVEHIQLGMPLDEAFFLMQERVAVEELDAVLLGLEIQRRSGGNLVELLEGVRLSLEEKGRLKSNLRIQTAQSHLSARVIGSMPILVAAGMALLDPAFIMPLFTTGPGLFLAALAVGLESLGFVLLRRVLEFTI